MTASSLFIRETELEQVLTTYTKINKSAAIFLGSSKPDERPSSTPHRSRSQQRAPPQLDTNLHGVTINGNPGMTKKLKDV